MATIEIVNIMETLIVYLGVYATLVKVCNNQREKLFKEFLEKSKDAPVCKTHSAVLTVLALRKHKNVIR